MMLLVMIIFLCLTYLVPRGFFNFYLVLATIIMTGLVMVLGIAQAQDGTMQQQMTFYGALLLLIAHLALGYRKYARFKNGAGPRA